jgi:hypothetical protein
MYVKGFARDSFGLWVDMERGRFGVWYRVGGCGSSDVVAETRAFAGERLMISMIPRPSWSLAGARDRRLRNATQRGSLNFEQLTSLLVLVPLSSYNGVNGRFLHRILFLV